MNFPYQQHNLIVTDTFMLRWFLRHKKFFWWKMRNDNEFKGVYNWLIMTEAENFLTFNGFSLCWWWQLWWKISEKSIMILKFIDIVSLPFMWYVVSLKIGLAMMMTWAFSFDKFQASVYNLQDFTTLRSISNIQSTENWIKVNWNLKICIIYLWFQIFD